jgi:hypothetical protein
LTTCPFEPNLYAYKEANFNRILSGFTDGYATLHGSGCGLGSIRNVELHADSLELIADRELAQAQHIPSLLVA